MEREREEEGGGGRAVQLSVVLKLQEESPEVSCAEVHHDNQSSAVVTGL